MSKAKSLTGRAVLSLLLLIGFYLLALAIAGTLMYFAYAQVAYSERVYGRLLLFCLIGAFIILKSIIPRRDKFVPPGPELTAAKHPELFRQITDIANATNQDKPTEVYIDFQVNAWVSQRGGFMGMGSRRVMGLGLPLLQILSVTELRAVLAHEFGHYHGGDTKLGPLVYKTRSAIERTLKGLANHSSILQKPFIWYGNMFLRTTHGVSRNQEYVADELAANVVGSIPLISGLKKLEGAAVAFDNFWKDEYVPALDSGYRPLLTEGFNRFLKASPVIDSMNKILAEELKYSNDSPYNTHPPLKERLEALEQLPSGSNTTDDRPALSLLNEIGTLEKEIFFTLFGQKSNDLKPLKWEEVGQEVYLKGWEELVQKYNNALNGVTPADLPKIAAEKGGDYYQRLLKEAEGLSSDRVSGLAFTLIGASLALTLKRKGWEMLFAPGLPIVFKQDELSIEPFSIFHKLYSVDIAEKLSEEEWLHQAEKSGILNENLGDLKISNCA